MATDTIKQFLDSAVGLELKEILLARLNELKSIDTLPEKDTPSHQAIAVKAQKLAYKIVKEILQDLMTFAGETKKRDKRDSYAINDEDL